VVQFSKIIAQVDERSLNLGERKSDGAQKTPVAPLRADAAGPKRGTYCLDSLFQSRGSFPGLLCCMTVEASEAARSDERPNNSKQEGDPAWGTRGSTIFEFFQR